MVIETVTHLIDDTSDNGQLIDETDKIELSLSLGSTIIVDAPSYSLED